MKRLLLVFCGALLVSAFGPLPSASAGWWPFHHHSKNSASASSVSAPAPKTSKSKPPKSKKEKHHHEKHARTDNTGTTPGPRSVGFWHKQPGPAGAGAN